MTIKKFCKLFGYEYYGGDCLYCEIYGNKFIAKLSKEKREEIKEVCENDAINIELDWRLL